MAKQQSCELFPSKSNEKSPTHMPLAARMRPRTLEEFVGQKHFLAPGKLLERALRADRLSSLIFYGPPGTGKTALAHCISNITHAEFTQINATSSGVAELRELLEAARTRRKYHNKRTILFVDEIHRFNKAQQEVLLSDVEDGNVIMIGATTQNPFFSVVAAVISRSIVVEFKPLSEDDIVTILECAIRDKDRGFGGLSIACEKDALRTLARLCEGDARRALNALEIAALTTHAGAQGALSITAAILEESLQKKAVVYDAAGVHHYDTISAFIKSMRGSDPDATVYWLAKMLYAGEDPRFIARRIAICAAEDVGNADPQALVVANAAVQISEFIGLPECRIPLAQAAIYVACAPKSNAAYLAIEKALSDVKSEKTQDVPEHLKNAAYEAEKARGKGKGYKYSHDYRNHYCVQDYLAQHVQYYFPQDLGQEKKMKAWLDYVRRHAQGSCEPKP